MPLRARWGKGPLKLSQTLTALRDTAKRQWGLGRDIIDSCPIYYKAMMVDKKKKKKTTVGSHTPTSLHSHQSNQLPASSFTVPYQTMSCIKYLNGEKLVVQAALAAYQLATCSP